MTTKEFFRRVSYYKSLDFAALFFMLLPDDSFIFKIIVISVDGIKSVYYSKKSISDIIETLSGISFCNVSMITLERYTKFQFDTDVNFFKSFWSRLSLYQKKKIINDNSLCNLRTFCCIEDCIERVNPHSYVG